jgi:hypothetical protein
MGWLVPASAAAWMILQVVMARSHSSILAGVATTIACIGFTALVVAVGGNTYLSLVRGEALGNEPMEPITLDVQGNWLRRHNPRSLRRNLKVVVDQIVHVRAEPVRQLGSGPPMGRLVLELGDGRRIKLIRCHDLRELQELAPELEERLGNYQAGMR